jgi:IS5 family transposase
MRQKRTIQASLFDLFSDHQIGRELSGMSDWLDRHTDLFVLVAADLGGDSRKDTGRQGLSAESVLRCGLLKQYRQLSYEELAFHLEDSASFRAFARLPFSSRPQKSALQSTISSVRAETWERINQSILMSAQHLKIESGATVRIDSTATDALMHEPTDSSLLVDAVRVMVRLLRRAMILPGGRVLKWRNHQRLARKRALAILYSRGKEKKAALYRDLIAATEACVAAMRRAALCLRDTSPEAMVWRLEAEHYLALIERVIHQTRRRVIEGEAVPAGEKLVSLFEPHADIIVKSRRGVHYGHKLNLTSGRSGLILDVVVEAGNPADAARFKPMLDRHVALYGKPPRQAVADAGYASLDNLRQAKDLGVRDVAFHSKRGIAVEDMVKSKWIYRKLRNFRAGIEAGISCLKRAYGLSRCTWRGLDHFKSYIWSSVVAYNLSLFGRLCST